MCKYVCENVCENVCVNVCVCGCVVVSICLRYTYYCRAGRAQEVYSTKEFSHARISVSTTMPLVETLFDELVSLP